MTKPSATYKLWKKLPDNAVGHALFSLGMVAKVPYFGTIVPHVDVMEPGHCEVTAPKWFGIHNHLGTFHAIAACNLAEVAMGMLMEATVPTSHRWIPKSMTVEYTGMAKTSLRAIAKLPELPDFDALPNGVEVAVPVSVVDTNDKVVVRAQITTWVTPA
ncbi:MAG: DUF4442 domain-containing protein [Nocardiaceae bacterium]|nr:DUF4442 domain-containing protein [Nocardiaceae bacterium]